MAELIRRHGVDTDQLQAAYFAARERRRSLAGVVDLFRSHRFVGTAAIAVTPIDTDASFPLRTGLITFQTAIRIHSLGSDPAQHRGLVFELGGTASGCVLWVGDQTIGFRAGGASAAADAVVATFDNGAEFADDIELDLVCAIRPGDGRVRLWGNGTELARATASGGDLGAGWASSEDGSFATALVTGVPADVPAVSQIAPDGFTVIEPLSVYVGSVPQHFV